MIELRWLRPAPRDEPVFLALLSEAERTRVLRFHQAQDRLSYAAAHALLRTLLSEAAGGAPKDWRFARTSGGKPRLDPADGRPDLRFSLSHTRGMVACAVAPALEVGVDVEPLHRLPDVQKLARAWFSPREADSLQSMAEAARSEAFLHLWTLKEAYLKATGEGIGRRMEEPKFDPDLITRVGEAILMVRGQAWTFRRVLTPAPFVLSLAFPAADEDRVAVHCMAAEVRACRLHPSTGSGSAAGPGDRRGDGAVHAVGAVTERGHAGQGDEKHQAADQRVFERRGALTVMSEAFEHVRAETRGQG